ncbi:MAG: PilZ domain-containing protein [Xanthobacteraceae bacterium]|jgi:predicted phosphoribosyltransferase
MELREQVDVLPRLAAKIFVYGISPIACTATEISEKGATLIVVSQLGIPDTFELAIAGVEKRHRCVVAKKAPHKIRVLFK